jgi:hypothetical protein
MFSFAQPPNGLFATKPASLLPWCFHVAHVTSLHWQPLHVGVGETLSRVNVSQPLSVIKIRETSGGIQVIQTTCTACGPIAEAGPSGSGTTEGPFEQPRLSS